MTDDTIKFIRLIRKNYPSGGALHIVLEDYNVSDDDIYWCINNTILNNFDKYYSPQSVYSFNWDKKVFLLCASMLLNCPEQIRKSIIEDSEN